MFTIVIYLEKKCHISFNMKFLIINRRILLILHGILFKNN